MTMTECEKPLTERTPADVRAIIDRLHEDRERYDRANRIVEARSCELEIAETTRALAIINRRATEAEDQRAAALDSGVCLQLADWARNLAHTPVEDGQHVDLRIRMSAVAAQLTAAADLAERFAVVERERDEALEDGVLSQRVCDIENDRAQLRSELDALRAQLAERDRTIETGNEAFRVVRGEWRKRALTEERVREVVRAAIHNTIGGPVAEEFGSARILAADVEGIATRAAKELAGAVVGLAQREADLREAFLAGKEWEAGRWPDDPKDADAAAAEYARSKAGG